jgi:FkbM family methyltransferase
MDLMAYLRDHARRRLLPPDHRKYLEGLRDGGFEPRVLYDIGSNELHWAREALEIWPDALILLFDANEVTRFLYGGWPHHISVLGRNDGEVVRFFHNDWNCTGSSMYRQVGVNAHLYSDDTYMLRRTRTLDSVVSERGWPTPDLVKIDVQGGELDVLAGGRASVAAAKHLIVELQHVEFNLGAPKVDVSLPAIEAMGWRCVAPLFSNNSMDGDYGFVRDIS